MLKVNRPYDQVLYIENAFPKSSKFIDLIESLDKNEKVNDIIPPWSYWEDGGPVRVDQNDPTKWEQVFAKTEESHRGFSKFFDWDLSFNENNNYWPRKSINKNHSLSHKVAYSAISMIEEDYIKALSIWCKETNNQMPEYITKNYCLRKYRTGGHMGPHIDRNIDNPLNSMDWTALIYLNDNYEGGELLIGGPKRSDVKAEIKPSAGSIVFLPCSQMHSVAKITSGNKYYIFLFMHTEYGTCTSLGEPYHGLNQAITKIRKKDKYYGKEES